MNDSSQTAIKFFRESLPFFGRIYRKRKINGGKTIDEASSKSFRECSKNIGLWLRNCGALSKSEKRNAGLWLTNDLRSAGPWLRKDGALLKSDLRNAGLLQTKGPSWRMRDERSVPGGVA